MTSDKWRLLLVSGLIWIATATMVLWLLGVWPRSTLAWLLVLGLGPIAFLLLDVVGELVGGAIGAIPGIRHADRAVERRTAGDDVSGVRIAYYLVRSLIILVPIVLVAWWLEKEALRVVPDAVRDWWHEHFN